ncbi:MAG TPA: response regulator transcription factor [Anaerolineales bacterium]|nr:response regulator transcription factor [Anaerolineales bacterium]
MTDPITLLIADDHPVVREGLAAMFNRRPDLRTIAEAVNGAEAVRLALDLRPDVVLMDLNMPELGGVDAIAQIRAAWPEARVVVMTTFDGDEDIFRALQAGARAYLLKDTPRDEIIETVRIVHAGGKRIPEEIAAKLADRMLSEPLTERERDVLRLIVAGHSNKEIGSELSIAEGTVKAHVNSLLGKLGVQDRTQAVTEALRRGLAHLE